MPEGRTEAYSVWRACERFKILPPGVSPVWEENDWWTQHMLLAYDQGRFIEEIELTRPSADAPVS